MRAALWIALGSLVSAPALAGTWSNLWRTPDQQGQALLADGHAAQAAGRFTDPRLKAYAELQTGRFAAAAKLLTPFKDATSEYNRGNALARSGQLPAALAAYDAALKQAPNDKDIRHNRDLVAQMLRQHPPQKSQSSSQTGGGQHAGGTGKSSQPSGGQHSGQGQNRKQGGGQSRSQGPNGASNHNSHGSAGSQGQGTQRTPASQGGHAGNQGTGAGSHAGALGASSQPGAGQGSGLRKGAGQVSGANGTPRPGQTPQTVPASGSGSLKQNSAEARREAAWAAALARKQAGSAGQKSGGPSRPAQTGREAASPGGPRTPKPKPVSEKTLALDQWLRQIPDNPAGLLRRKFLIEYMMRHPGATAPGGSP